MANTPITELDFFAAKDQFKSYLRNQTQFRDYDFEGSNMNVLLDVLAYNTFLNNFYTNMTFSEMFLDTAQKRDSVVSHAKELNYLPRSSVSAKASVRVTFSLQETSVNVLIPRGTTFRTNYQGDNYSFVTSQSYVARRTTSNSNGINTYVATEYDSSGVEIGIDIYEGAIIPDIQREGFYLSENDLKCVITNETVDVNSVRVFVGDEFADVLSITTSPEIFQEYQYKKDIFGVLPDDPVFYIEPYFEEKYVVTFGRNIFGRQPSFTDKIFVDYRVCSGSAPNGAALFSTSFVTNARVETISPASGGADKESLESIRYFAPKSIQIQERAITSSDYEVLLKQRFPQIQSISVYGGDELDPPRYGKVAISVNLQGNALISDGVKSDFERYISDKSPLTIQPIFINPEYIYVKAVVNVNYSINLTTKSKQQIESEIRQTIQLYSANNLNDFGKTLRISKLTTAIDNVDKGILSNSISLNPIIEYSPPLILEQNPAFSFNAKLIKPYPFRGTTNFETYKPAIKSTVFDFDGTCSFLQDDGLGNIQVLSDNIQNIQVLNPAIGTVDYDNGIVRLSNFAVNGFAGSAIQIRANTENVNVSAPKSRILVIRDGDITVNITETT